MEKVLIISDNHIVYLPNAINVAIEQTDGSFGVTPPSVTMEAIRNKDGYYLICHELDKDISEGEVIQKVVEILNEEYINRRVESKLAEERKAMKRQVREEIMDALFPGSRDDSDY